MDAIAYRVDRPGYHVARLPYRRGGSDSVRIMRMGRTWTVAFDSRDGADIHRGFLSLSDAKDFVRECVEDGIA